MRLRAFCNQQLERELSPVIPNSPSDPPRKPPQGILARLNDPAWIKPRWNAS